MRGLTLKLTIAAAIALSGCALEEFDETSQTAEAGVGEAPAPPSPPVEGEGPQGPRPDEPMCQGVDEAGTCRSTTVVWCEGGVVRTIDCAAIGDVCGWDADQARYFCVDEGAAGTPPENPNEPAPEPNEPGPNEPGPNEPEGPCGGLDYLGECQGTIARWCDAGTIKEVDCAWWGQPCGWVDAESGYYCGGEGQGPNTPPETPPPGNNPPPPADPPPEEPPPEDPPPPPPPPAEPEPEPEPPLDDACGTDQERAVVMLTNQARAMFGQAALACAQVNTLTARMHSQDMCDSNYFSHTGRDGSQPWDRLRRQGGNFRTAGENIAYGYGSPQAVHDGWMNSAGHRQNILSGGYGRIGVGLAPCNGRNYWTQVFSD